MPTTASNLDDNVHGPQPTTPRPEPPRDPQLPVAPGASTRPVDLKSFIRNLTPHRVSGGTPTAGGYRSTAYVMKDGPKPVEAESLDQIGFLDGIQQRELIARFHHRDVVLS